MGEAGADGEPVEDIEGEDADGMSLVSVIVIALKGWPVDIPIISAHPEEEGDMISEADE